MCMLSADAAKKTLLSLLNISPDMDIPVLSLTRYPGLCENVNFVTETGQRHRLIKLKQELKIEELPGLHALSGAHITSSFAGKGWKGKAT